MVSLEDGPRRNAAWSVREVVLGGVRYPYHLGHDCLDRIAWELSRYDADRFLVISDDTVLRLHGDALLSELNKYAPVDEFSLPPGEEIKTLRTLTNYLERAIQLGASRRSVVSFGGGVPGNLAGLLAGLLYRGVRLVHVPTTTVAAMDSTISLKQAVNSPFGKNHIGMYHAPEAVFADVKLLQTLPEREIRSGLCEATKNCLAIRAEAIPALRTVLTGGARDSAASLLWLLDESLLAKTQVTLADPKEQAAGLVLEYGHTIGHAIELCDHRRQGTAGVSHGDAIAIGMRVAGRISAAMGELDAAGVALHDELMIDLGGPTAVPADVTVDDLMATVRVDNKRGYVDLRADQAAMVLLREPGRPLGSRDLPLVAVDLNIIEAAITTLCSTSRRVAGQ